jgi:hypothetical protein
MTAIQIDEVTRLTLTERSDGLLRLGVEHGNEDMAGNVDWQSPDGSWAYLRPGDVERLRAALSDLEITP